MAFYDESAYSEYYSSKNTFATASIILCAIAIITFSSIMPTLFAGSLSIIFAILSRKGTCRMHPYAKFSIICSAISIILVVAFFIFFLNYMPELLQNEAYRNELEYMLEYMYGNEIDADMLLDSIESGNMFKLPSY